MSRPEPVAEVIDLGLFLPRTPDEVYRLLTSLETPPPPPPPPGGERLAKAA